MAHVLPSDGNGGPARAGGGTVSKGKRSRVPDVTRKWMPEMPDDVLARIGQAEIVARALAADELERKAAAATDHDVHMWLCKQQKLVLRALPQAEVAAKIAEHHKAAEQATVREVERFHTDAARKLHRDNPLPSVETLAKAVSIVGSHDTATLAKAVGGRRIPAGPDDTGQAGKYQRLAESTTDPDLRYFYQQKAEQARERER